MCVFALFINWFVVLFLFVYSILNLINVVCNIRYEIKYRKSFYLFVVDSTFASAICYT